MRRVHEACKSYLGMGTVISHRAYGTRASEAIAAAERETVRLERVLSRFLPHSDIARLNRSAGTGNVRIGRDACEVLASALECARITEGCFDVTVGPLVRLWADARPEAEPSRPSIDAARELVGAHLLRLDKHRRIAGLTKAGQYVDLGGIGKGYAADYTLSVFRRYGVLSAFTDFGGNVATLGAKPDGNQWNIGIRHPRWENALIGAVAVTDGSVVTSGDDQRYYVTPEGKRRHHILDPATGMPAESGLLSVTVVSASSMVADALATALFTAGLKRGLLILKRFPGAQAVFIDCEQKAYVTRGLAGRFTAARDIRTEVIGGSHS